MAPTQTQKIPEPKLTFDINRDLYDRADGHVSKFVAAPGVNEEIVRLISTTKNEPDWMLQKRLKALEHFNKTPIPTWGPDLSDLNFDEIIFFIDPNTKETNNWDEVPQEIKDTFDKLGIPEAEKKALAGVGAQYDSSVVYHSIEKTLKDKGVIFENMDVAVHKYPELVKKYFMTRCIPITDHKFIMLHAAVWSGGTFIYVPKNVKVELPLQAYFRMNTQAGGQFEHTLIILDEGAELHYIEGCSSPRYSKNSLHAGCVEIYVGKNAKMRYSSIENWSRNVYNLNTKRAMVDSHATMEWINGNMGSSKTMLYPCSVLVGEGAHADNLGVAFAGCNQDQDTGSKVIHVAPNTTSIIRAKSLSKDGGISTYRGLVKVTPSAYGAKSQVQCDALLLDSKSSTVTYPYMKIDNSNTSIGHEASVSKVNDHQLHYLLSRGLTEQDAMKTIVSGFIEPIVKALPLEYAVELNKLIELEVEGM
jgi:Fe-S cluster assembly protein SufB